MHTSLEYYPFLLEIPGQLLDMIDLEVLHIPTNDENQLIVRLSHDLGKNVVVYRKDITSKGVHLCHVLRAADLTSPQLETLNTVEKLFPSGQVVVAYDKPLKIVGN